MKAKNKGLLDAHEAVGFTRASSWKVKAKRKKKSKKKKAKRW